MPQTWSNSASTELPPAVDEPSSKWQKIEQDIVTITDVGSDSISSLEQWVNFERFVLQCRIKMILYPGDN